MPVLERGAVAHLGIRRTGNVEPLCGAWRSTWNWTLVPAEVTCPHCRAALARGEGNPPEAEPLPKP